MEGRDTQNNTIETTPEAARVKKPASAPQDATTHGPQTEAQDFTTIPSQNVTAEQGGVDEKKSQESLSQDVAADSVTFDSGPGFVDVNGDVGGPGHNETEVDIVTVPCPGADPVQTWTYDHTHDRRVCSINANVGSRTSLRMPSPWVTRDLRRRISIARVFLYKHRALEEGMTLKSLSEDLLDQIEQTRRGTVSVPPPSRPLAHTDHVHA